MTSRLPIRRALLSVTDKTGLGSLGKALHDRGVTLISTGGTAAHLRAAGLPVTDVSEVTGFPEILDGRVKTLHPKIHGGLLGRRDIHRDAMRAHGIEDIDLLVVNLYAFEETAARKASFEETVENIDIGGPALIRAAAKNHEFVTVIVETSDYTPLLAELDAHDGATSPAFRRAMAAKAYARTGAYDAAIAAWFAAEAGDLYPPRLVLAGQLKETLRYGENPHQSAAFYVTGESRPGIATALQVQGKALSDINLLDADAAFELVAEFSPAKSAAVAIIKHANPCGVAIGPTLKAAYERALLCDPVSRFGGIIAVNQTLDGEAAEEIMKLFTEVLIAPDADEDARKVVAAKKNVRLLLTKGLPDPYASGVLLRSVAGGFLAQTRDTANADTLDLKVVTKRKPTAQELADLRFAFRVCKHVKSNAIVYAKDGATVGIGAGQMSRLDSARIAAHKAREAAEAAGLAAPLTTGSVAASDAFFPFPDGLLAVANAGATAVIQPGGSVRDDEVIAAADEKGLAMVFSGTRQFRH